MSLRRAEAAPRGSGRGARTIRVVSLRLALPPIALAIVSVAVAHAEKAATTVVAKQDLQAKVAYCETCHGASGRGFRGYYPIPRAGSTGRCNTGVKSLCWGFECQGLPWPFV